MPTGTSNSNSNRGWVKSRRAKRIPSSACRSLCLPVVWELWEGHGSISIPRVSSGGGSCSQQAGSHHTQPIPALWPCSSRISPKTLSAPGVRFPGIPNSRQILEFDTHRSHQGPVSDGKTLGGLKTTKILQKINFSIPRSQTWELQGLPNPPNIPGVWLSSCSQGSGAIPSSCMSLNVAQTDRQPQPGLVVMPEMLPEWTIPKNSWCDPASPLLL